MDLRLAWAGFGTSPLVRKPGAGGAPFGSSWWPTPSRGCSLAVSDKPSLVPLLRRVAGQQRETLRSQHEWGSAPSSAPDSSDTRSGTSWS